jgi:hypothetical protein
MIDGVSSMPFSATTMPPIKEPEVSSKTEVIDMSRKQFSMDRAKVEQDVIDWHKNNIVPPAKKEEKRVEPVIVKTVEKKEFEKPKYTKRETPAVPAPLLDGNDDFVPLKELKSKPIVINNVTNNNQTVNNNGRKLVSEKSLSELRAVLQNLNKNKIKEDISSPELKKAETVEKSDVVVKDTPKEIPEDKLRQMLKVDNNN